jgi:hypothetical protein
VFIDLVEPSVSVSRQWAAPWPVVKWLMPMTDTSTMRCTPAFRPNSCRLRAAVVKNSRAAWGAPGLPLAVPLAASMTHSTATNAFAKPSPVTTFTPVHRDIGTTS